MPFTVVNEKYPIVMANLFADLPSALASEITETLIQSSAIRIERIVSHGQASPDGFWYDQAENEFVLLARGSARLQFADRVLEMNPGDWVHIPAGQKHRIAWTTPDEQTVWLAVFYH